jgi:membrane protease subunit (stomatin/prohibitin family)
MPLFEGHIDRGLKRLFIEMPDEAKTRLAWKWPDQQIIQHSQLNVDLDYQAVFTNLGKVIGVMGPGRYPLDEGASLALGWLVDRLTGNAYYDTEIYFIATREKTNIEFGGPVDNLTDGPTGLIVTVRVFGELAFKVTDPALLLAKLIGTGAEGDLDGEMCTWVKDQTLAAIRAVLPGLVAEHGVLAMGQIQEATAQAAVSKVNEKLAAYGLNVTTFGELNVNMPDADAQQLKQLAATKAYSNMAGSFDAGVRGEAALEIAQGVAAGNVGAQGGVMAGMVMGLPMTPGTGAVPAPAGQVAQPTATVTTAPSTPAQPQATSAAPSATNSATTTQPAPAGAHFCSQCGAAVAPDTHYCPNCGSAITAPQS